MPQEMARRCILAGCPDGGVVLDPFSGSATTGMAAQQLGRRYIGIDLNADYHDLALRTRLRNAALPLPAQEVTA
jgi:DNA modification methylase